MNDIPDKDQQLAVVEGRPSELVFVPDRSLKAPKWGIWVVTGIVVLSVLGSAFRTNGSCCLPRKPADCPCGRLPPVRPIGRGSSTCAGSSPRPPFT